MKNPYYYFINLLVLIFIAIVPLTSYAGKGSSYNKVVFFGDSLSDNGNLFGFDWGYLPKSPPYFEGRFTNGNTWSERVAQYLHDKKKIDSVNFAIGGETTIFHNPANGYLPYSLTASLISYLARTVFSERSSSLFVIWIGSNDYLSGSTDIDQLTTDVVGNIKATIESLIYHGGLNFLVVTLPDLSITPYGKESDISQDLKKLSLKHNEKLETAIAEIQNSYKEVNIHLFHLNELFVKLVADPEFVNKQYKTNIKNTSDSCWKGGYTLRKNTANEETILRKIEEQLQRRSKVAASNDDMPTQLNQKELAKYIAASPDLLEVYSVTEQADQGDKPCKNPDEYAFWDHIHPSAAVHKVLALAMIDYINENYAAN